MRDFGRTSGRLPVSKRDGLVTEGSPGRRTPPILSSLNHDRGIGSEEKILLMPLDMSQAAPGCGSWQVSSWFTRTSRVQLPRPHGR